MLLKRSLDYPLKLTLIKSLLLLILCVPLFISASEKVLLEINSVSQSLHQKYTLQQLQALPQYEMKVKTPWTTDSHIYKGPYLEDVFALAGIEGNRLTMFALDHYRVSFDFQRIKKYKPILALQVDGELLTIRSKGPIWVMLPLDDFKALGEAIYQDYLVWQLVKIDVEKNK